MILTARQTDKLEKHAHVLRRACNVAVEVMLADLDDPEKAEALWARASKNRQIGVLVNNAGLGRNGAFAEPAGWPRKAASISINIVAATILMARAAEHMNAQCTGAHPERGLHRRAVYHAIKAYLGSLPEVIAKELSGSGVIVTALCPGATETNFFATDDAVKAFIISRFPLPSAETMAAKAGPQ